MRSTSSFNGQQIRASTFRSIGPVRDDSPKTPWLGFTFEPPAPVPPSPPPYERWWPFGLCAPTVSGGHDVCVLMISLLPPRIGAYRRLHCTGTSNVACSLKAGVPSGEGPAASRSRASPRPDFEAPRPQRSSRRAREISSGIQGLRAQVRAISVDDQRLPKRGRLYAAIGSK
jgi:hypothetical protein